MLERILLIGFAGALAFVVYAYWPVVRYVIGL